MVGLTLLSASLGHPPVLRKPPRMGVPRGDGCPENGCPKMGWVSREWVSREGMGVPRRDGLGVPRRDGCPEKGWVSREGMGVPRRDGCPEKGWCPEKGCFEKGWVSRTDGVRCPEKPEKGWCPEKGCLPRRDVSREGMCPREGRCPREGMGVPEKEGSIRNGGAWPQFLKWARGAGEASRVPRAAFPRRPRAAPSSRTWMGSAVRPGSRESCHRPGAVLARSR